MKKSILIVAAALLAALVSCNSNTQVDLNGVWQVVAVDGAEISDTLANPVFMFDSAEALYHIEPGVNLVNGSYSYEKGVLTFGEGAMTRMMGPDELMNIEMNIMNAVAAPLSVKYENDVLSLCNEDGKALIQMIKEN